MARAAATEKKQPRIKVPPSWAGGKCMCCGKIYDVRKGNFSKTQSQWFMGNDGYLPWCNDCREKMFEFYSKKYNDEDEAIDRLAMMFDTYVDDKLLEASEHSAASALKINTYMGRLNMRQHAGKSYDDVSRRVLISMCIHHQIVASLKSTKRRVELFSLNINAS